MEVKSALVFQRKYLQDHKLQKCICLLLVSSHSENMFCCCLVRNAGMPGWTTGEILGILCPQWQKFITTTIDFSHQGCHVELFNRQKDKVKKIVPYCDARAVQHSCDVLGVWSRSLVVWMWVMDRWMWMWIWIQIQIQTPNKGEYILT